jgi:hypothetical protein
MATTTTPQPEVKQALVKPKLPSLSPYLVPNLLCSNRACNQILSNPKTGIDKDTGEQVVIFTCENCGYDALLSLTHSNAKVAPKGKVQLKGLEEGLLGHARP